MAGKISLIPLGIEKPMDVIPSTKARKYVGLPATEVSILLHFGVIHGSKDIRTMIKAVNDLDHVILFHAGKITTKTDISGLIASLHLHDHEIINDSYISEEEKMYYFAAAYTMANCTDVSNCVI